MSIDPESEREKLISPEEAFSVLGDETRLQILRTLGEAGGPLSFSELYDRIEYDDTANFNYHLTKLVGHFVRETDEGYMLRRAGSRIVESVLSGAVTDDPVLDRVPVETPCPMCGGSMEVSYREESLVGHCSECKGTRSGAITPAHWPAESSDDIVGHLRLPPAGIEGRTPSELIDRAEIWSAIQGRALARGVCPRCAASVDQSVRVCDDHRVDGGRCESCGQRFRVSIHRACTNCIVEGESPFAQHLLANTDLMGFMIDHGIDPLAPRGFHLAAVEETVLSTNPFEAHFTFTADGDAITLTVTDDLSVVDVARVEASETT